MMQNEPDITENRRTIEALLRGDEKTFERIYKSYFVILKNYSAGIVGDAEVAYEIVQNIFVTLWENRKKLDPGKSLRNYLLRSAHNNSLRHLKTRALHQAHQEVIQQETREEEQENVIQHDTPPDPSRELQALLDELPERSRQVMTMSHLENMKTADIAAKLGISTRTVETILYQAMKKLRGNIKK